MRARAVVRTVLVAVAVVAAACGPGADDGPVRVAVGSGEQQAALGGLTEAWLEAAGHEVEPVVVDGGTRELRGAARGGAVDVLWAQTGAAWGLGLGQPAPPADPVESFERVRAADAGSLVWLGPSGADARLALHLPAEEAAEVGTTGRLVGMLADGRRLCAGADFVDRPAGLDAVAEAHGVAREGIEVVRADEREAVELVVAGDCDAALAPATSAEAHLAGLAPVTDERGVLPSFLLAPVATPAALEAHPGLAEDLDRLAASLDRDAVAGAAAAVLDGADPSEVGAAHLGAVADDG